MRKLTKSGFIDVYIEQKLTMIRKIPKSRFNEYHCGYCGDLKEIRSDWVSRKKDPVKSCGCLRLKDDSLSDHLDYNIWVKMRLRCHDPKNHKYIDYGNRGIFVCDEWFESFKSFNTDMGDRPNIDYSIERIDNNRGYELNNCKWILKSAQANNKRRTRYISYAGRNLSVADWSRLTKISIKLICQRIDRDKKTIGEALGYE